MVKVYVDTDDEFYMDGYLKANLDLCKEAVKKDWDMIFLVDGGEGAGKSVIAQQLAKYCDSKFHIDRIAFTATGFEKAVLAANKFDAIIFDEAYTGLSSRAAMSGVNKSLVRMLAEIRQKNLFIFIVMPTYFDLDKYVTLWRSRALIHVYANSFKRGFFKFYSRSVKKDMYVMGKKYYSYCKKPDFRGRFTNHYTVDEQEYRKMKRDSLNKDEEVFISPKLMKKQILNEVFLRLKDIKYLTNVQKAEIMGFGQATWDRRLAEYRLTEGLLSVSVITSPHHTSTIT